ncbi:hypothetical protein CLU79DRAFT_842404, partial [Phycomyces nitens]
MILDVSYFLDSLNLYIYAICGQRTSVPRGSPAQDHVQDAYYTPSNPPDPSVQGIPPSFTDITLPCMCSSEHQIRRLALEALNDYPDNADLYNPSDMVEFLDTKLRKQYGRSIFNLYGNYSKHTESPFGNPFTGLSCMLESPEMNSPDLDSQILSLQSPQQVFTCSPNTQETRQSPLMAIYSETSPGYGQYQGYSGASNSSVNIGSDPFEPHSLLPTPQINTHEFQHESTNNNFFPQLPIVCPTSPIKGALPVKPMNHMCTICGYGTMYSSNYTRHIQKHKSDRKKYVCSSCNKRYVSKFNLERHRENLGHL